MIYLNKRAFNVGIIATCLLLFASIICNGQDIVTNIGNLLGYKEIVQSKANSHMKSKGWEYQRNISAKSGWAYTVWGNPNKNNSYYSQTLAIGFKIGNENIVAFTDTSPKFHSSVKKDLSTYGYTLESKNNYKDAQISIYARGDKRIIILVKPTVKKGISFTQHTYTVCNKDQIEYLM